MGLSALLQNDGQWNSFIHKFPSPWTFPPSLGGEEGTTEAFDELRLKGENSSGAGFGMV